jgi:hypothetical protein
MHCDSILGKDRTSATAMMIATCVMELGARIENLGNELHVDNFFFSPDLLHDLHTETINHWYCQTILMVVILERVK